jgi:hypothetical protein
MESQSFGTLFNSEAVNSSLATEAWLSRRKAEKIGGDALIAYERCEAGEMVEVSVGVMAELHAEEGEHDGVPYGVVWDAISSDHLAILKEDQIGACSVDGHGCGTNRHAAGLTDFLLVEAMKNQPGRIMRALTGAQAFDLRETYLAHTDSDYEIHSKLWDLLDASVEGFYWLVDVFQGMGEVIYTTSTSNEVFYYMQTFTVSDDNTVELGNDPVPVERIQRFEPLEGNGTGLRDAADTQTTQGDKEMRNPKDLDSGGCTCNKPPEEVKEEPAAAVEEVAAVEPEEDEETVTLSRADLEEYKAMAACFRKRQAEDKAALVDKILAYQSEDGLSKADLEAMKMVELETLDKAVQAVPKASPGGVFLSTDSFKDERTNMSAPVDGWTAKAN